MDIAATQDARALLLQLAVIKAQADILAERKEEVQGLLVTTMRTHHASSISATLPTGETVKGTLVQGTRVVIDGERLQKQLTASQWKKVTTNTLDNRKLEAAVAIGVIDANVVAAVSTVNDVKPYVKVSGKTPDTGGSVVKTKNDAVGTGPAHRKVRRPIAAGAPQIG